MGIDLEGKYLFDLNYLDCSKSQYVSYLKQMGYRVEALYYNCLDSTNEIMIQIIKQKKSRYHFDELGFQHSDWQLIGLEKRDIHSESLYNIQEGIKEIIDSGNIVFVSVDTFHLPHRKQSYQKEKSPHSIMIKGFRDNLIDIIDETAPIFSKFQYPISELEIAYKNGCGFRYISYFEPITFNNMDDLKEKTKKLFQDFIDNRNETYELFDSVDDLLKLKSPYFNNLVETLQHLSASFTLLAGSREMFVHFANFVDFDDEVLNLAKKSSRIADSLRNMLNKGILRNRVKENLVLEKVNTLWEIEIKLNQLLLR